MFPPASAIFFFTLQPVHADVIRRFFNVQYVLLAPICPHFCEHVWGTLLGNAGSVTSAPWPATSGSVEEDKTLLAVDRYLQVRTRLLTHCGASGLYT